MKYDLEIAKQVAFKQQRNARANISGHKIGVCLVAEDDHGDIAYFGGCNIELATSRVFHAETVALTNAISHNHTKFHCIVVTSNDEVTATLCGYCRQDYLYANPDIRVVVLNPDGSIKLDEILKNTMKFPYLGRSRLNE